MYLIRFGFAYFVFSSYHISIHKSTKIPGQKILPGNRLRDCIKHILDKNTVALCGAIHQNMGRSDDEPVVLNNRAAGHE